MNSNKANIQVIINKYFSGKTSAKEMQLIGEWLNSSPDNKVTFSQLKKDAEEQEIKNSKGDWQHFLNRYDDQLETPQKNKHIISFISIAASVSLVISFSFHFFNKPLTPLLEAYPAQEPTSATHTTLSLANGTNIPLEKEHATIEVENDGKSILIEKTEIVKNEEINSSAEFNQLNVPYGRTARLTLADGTMVWLNAGSQLVFPSSFNSETREVLLRGEGFFDVAHNQEKTFKVLTQEMTFTVLGTSFNINSYPDKSQVDAVLVEGSLHIENNSLFNKKEHTLKPGEKSTFNIEHKQIRVHNVNTKLFTSWKDGHLTLHKNSLHNLVAQIENYYNCSIDVPSELAKKQIEITGKILLDEDPEQVYKALSDLIDVTYQIKDNKVIMSKR